MAQVATCEKLQPRVERAVASSPQEDDFWIIEDDMELSEDDISLSLS